MFQNPRSRGALQSDGEDTPARRDKPRYVATGSVAETRPKHRASRPDLIGFSSFFSKQTHVPPTGDEGGLVRTVIMGSVEFIPGNAAGSPKRPSEAPFVFIQYYALRTTPETVQMCVFAYLSFVRSLIGTSPHP